MGFYCVAKMSIVNPEIEKVYTLTNLSLINKTLLLGLLMALWMILIMRAKDNSHSIRITAN